MAPRTNEQIEGIKKETKEKIQKSAVYLFSRKGISVTVSEIANHAKISQGLMYRYYNSKTDLILELVKTASQIAVDGISAIANINMPAKDKINIISNMMIEMLKGNEQGSDTFLFMIQVYLNLSEELLKVYNWGDSPLIYLGSIIEQGQIEGTIKEGDKNKLSILYWAAVQGLCCYKAINMIDFPDGQMLSDILLKGDKT